jgi:hypothetical protein
MVGLRERPPAADGNEPGVAVLGQDHGSTVRRWAPPWPLLAASLEARMQASPMSSNRVEATSTVTHTLIRTGSPPLLTLSSHFVR